jgi:hypothetical protein
MMNRIRQLTGADLQIFEQVGAFLVQHPQYDLAVVKTLHETGFTSLWQIFRNESPHLYDYSLLIEAIPDPLERQKFASNQSKDEPAVRKRFIESFETNKTYYNLYKLDFFKTLRDLNYLLINESKLREAVCLLASRG